MHCKFHLALRHSGTLVAALLLLAPGFATSAQLEEAAEPLQELEEITVHSERLAVRITEAEDQFFKLYNVLNDDDDYRMICGDRPLQPGSRIMTRTCVPNFFYTTFAPPPVNWGSCSGEFWGQDGRVYSPGPCVDGGYQPPSTDFLLMARGEDWRRHMMNVIRSDPRLGHMAGQLDELHRERRLVEQRFAVLTRPAERTAGPKAGRISPGPRSL